jgi:hypothetical protein
MSVHGCKTHEKSKNILTALKTSDLKCCCAWIVHLNYLFTWKVSEQVS